MSAEDKGIGNATNDPRWWLTLPYKVAGVFEGGGAKGVAYIGALQAIRDQNCWFSAVAGSSAGAITAALIASGLTLEEFGKHSIDALKMLHIRKWGAALGRLRNYGGLFSKDSLLKWMDTLLIEQVLKFQPNVSLEEPVTFSQLYKATEIELNIVAADLSIGRQIVFNHYDTPDCQVADAVLASSSIPFAFPSSLLTLNTPDTPEDQFFDTVVDGGVWANFPMFIFRDPVYCQNIRAIPRPKDEVIVGFLLQEETPIQPNLRNARFERNLKIPFKPSELRQKEKGKDNLNKIKKTSIWMKLLSLYLWLPNKVAAYCRNQGPAAPFPLGLGRWPIFQSKENKKIVSCIDETLKFLYFPIGWVLFLVVLALGLLLVFGLEFWALAYLLITHGLYSWYFLGLGPFLILVIAATVILAPVLSVTVPFFLLLNYFLLRPIRYLLYGLTKTYVAAPGALDWAYLDPNVIALPIPEQVTMLSFDIGDTKRRHELNELLKSAYEKTVERFREKILPQLAANSQIQATQSEIKTPILTEDDGLLSIQRSIEMKLSLKSLSITAAILWGGSVFLTGIANMIWPTYAIAFLQMLDSIYPGYHADGTFWSVIVATLYAVVDGAICAALFGWIYNWFAGGKEEGEEEEVERE